MAALLIVVWTQPARRAEIDNRSATAQALLLRAACRGINGSPGLGGDQVAVVRVIQLAGPLPHGARRHPPGSSMTAPLVMPNTSSMRPS